MHLRLISTTATVAGLLAAGYYMYWRRRRFPTKWKLVGTLKNIYCWPIKSGHSVDCKEVVCEYEGLRCGRMRDRSFMVINSEGKFITARTHPYITQIECNVEGAVATLTFRVNNQTRPLKLNLDDLERRKVKTLRYGYEVATERSIRVVDCGAEAAEWLKSIIVEAEHKGPAASPRLVYIGEKSLPADKGIFSDDASYMLLTEKSLEDINNRIDDPVSIRNFRPNFFVSGTTRAYEEDEWEWVRIGDVVFKYMGPCLRCVLTTVGADTGRKNPSMEPLKTLKTFRQVKDPELRRTVGEAPIFGAFLGLRSRRGHVVRAGDLVYVNDNSEET